MEDRDTERQDVIRVRMWSKDVETLSLLSLFSSLFLLSILISLCCIFGTEMIDIKYLYLLVHLLK